QGALKMFLTKLTKVAAVLLLSVGLLGMGAGTVAQRVLADKSASGAPPAVAKNEQARPAVVAAPAEPASPVAARTVRVVVLDPQDKPLPSAKILASIWTEEKGFKHNRDYETDAAGAAQIELPKTFYILRLWASKKPFVTMCAGWEQNELASIREF